MFPRAVGRPERQGGPRLLAQVRKRGLSAFGQHGAHVAVVVAQEDGEDFQPSAVVAERSKPIEFADQLPKALLVSSHRGSAAPIREA